MNIKKLITQYLSAGRVMQIATIDDAKPWVCSVYFVTDNELNLYWLSFADRRHSLNLKINDAVAAAIVIESRVPVVGLQTEGRAERIEDGEIIESVMKSYVAKYNQGKSFVSNFQKGINKHQVYRLQTSRFVLFDEKNFPKEGTQELILKK